MSEASEKRAGMTPWLRYETGEALPPERESSSWKSPGLPPRPGDEVRDTWRV